MRNIETVLRVLAEAQAEARKWAFRVQSLENETESEQLDWRDFLRMLAGLPPLDREIAPCIDTHH